MKLYIVHNYLNVLRSHPVWVRGLKHFVAITNKSHYLVAPRVGAWIETLIRITIMLSLKVAPRVGAWIETSSKKNA